METVMAVSDFEDAMAVLVEKVIARFSGQFTSYANTALNFHREQYGWPMNTHISSLSSRG